MLIHFTVFSFTSIYFFNLVGVQRVLADSNVVKENEKSPSTPENEYRFRFTLSKDKLMWEDASRACKKKGMSLASFDTIKKVGALNSTFERESLDNTNAYSETGEYWVGGFREHSNLAKFKWLNGKLVGSFDWKVGKPNYRSNDYCLEIELAGIVWLWNDVACVKLNRYICMYEAPDEETKNKDKDEGSKKPNNHEEGYKNLEAMESTTKTTTKALETTTLKAFISPFARHSPFFIVPKSQIMAPHGLYRSPPYIPRDPMYDYHYDY